MILLVVSGSLIAQSMPSKYYNSGAFRWKMALLAVALAVTVMLFRHSAGTASSPALLRVLALLSLLLWAAVGFSGRLIGFL